MAALAAFTEEDALGLDQYIANLTDLDLQNLSGSPQLTLADGPYGLLELQQQGSLPLELLSSFNLDFEQPPPPPAPPLPLPSVPATSRPIPLHLMLETNPPPQRPQPERLLPTTWEPPCSLHQILPPARPQQQEQHQHSPTAAMNAPVLPQPANPGFFSGISSLQSGAEQVNSGASWAGTSAAMLVSQPLASQPPATTMHDQLLTMQGGFTTCQQPPTMLQGMLAAHAQQPAMPSGPVLPEHPPFMTQSGGSVSQTTHSGGATAAPGTQPDSAVLLQTQTTRQTSDTQAHSGEPTTGELRPYSGGLSSKSKLKSPNGSKLNLRELEQVLIERQQQLAMLTEQNQKLKDKTRLLERVIKCRDDQLKILQQVQQLAAAHGPVPPHLADEQIPNIDSFGLEYYMIIGSMTKEQMWRVLKQAVSEVSSLLLSIDRVSGGSPNHQALQQLTTTMQALLGVTRYTALVAPHTLLLLRKPCPPGTEAANEDHWREMVACMHLSEPQKQDAAVLTSLYTSWSNKVRGDRDKLSSELAQLQEQMEASGCGGPAGLGGSSSTVPSTSIAAMRLRERQAHILEHLHRSLIQERCLMMLVEQVFKDLMEPLQLGRLIVQSYPFLPDMLAIMNAVAKQQLQDGQGQEGQEGKKLGRHKHKRSHRNKD